MGNRIFLLLTFAFLLVGFTFSSPLEGSTTPSAYSGATMPVAGGEIFLPLIGTDTTSETPWPTVGANPERTSWTPEEVRGNLNPVWYKPFEPYIPHRVQIIAAYNTLYVATSAGLYALDAATGAEKWVYPTEMPLGHSPTVEDGVVYVGGFDHKIHAIDARSGVGRWTFEAGAGFQTNPLVTQGMVYAGNRDGFFYAVNARTGELAWKYETDGPILYSAAYKDGVVFFASNDSHAYAFNARTGALVWKSEKLPGAGFYSWWPVVWRDRVIFSGSNHYRSDFYASPGPGKLASIEHVDIYPNHASDPRGTLVGPLGEASGSWALGTPTIDAKRILDYFSQKPWRRTVFVLDRFSGQERETAPVLWAGNDGSAVRYPPVVGADGILYQQNNYMSDEWIAGGHISGWQPGVPFISVVSSDWGAVDEPHAASAGGNLVYWNLCCDRQSGAFDVTQPEIGFADRYKGGIRPATGGPDHNREWVYYAYDLEERIPGYNVRYHNAAAEYYKPNAQFGGPDGVYGFHGDTNPPIPYQGMLFNHRGNSVIAFSPESDAPKKLPMAVTVAAPSAQMTTMGAARLRARLEAEVQKIVQAGHLRPGYMGHGLFDSRASSTCGDALIDYWHHPAETLYTLIMTLPHLSPELQQDAKIYLRSEFAAYPPYAINHVGWHDGAARSHFDLPPEVEADLVNYPPAAANHAFRTGGGWEKSGVWGLNPFVFYSLWKYADLIGDAPTIFEASRDRLEPLPPDEVLLSMPNVHNAYIAGYIGYLELEALAGYSESTGIRNELTRLLALRATHFTHNSAYSTAGEPYCLTLNVADDFMFMVPELAGYLRQHALDKVAETVKVYDTIAPYWFVSFAPDGFAENATVLLHDTHGLFMTKAWILAERQQTLERYLDVPGFPRGDLYYIQKLVVTIEAAGTTPIERYAPLKREGR